MIKLGVVMDPMAAINPKKDSTLAMLLEAQHRGWQLNYMEQSDLFLRDGTPYAQMCELNVTDDSQQWHHFGNTSTQALSDLDVVLMRKDPPFDIDYIYTTYLLELAEAKDSLIVNKPQSLRDANEKLYTSWFPQCTAPSLVTSKASLIKDFLNEHDDIILKPLSGMGGVSIFRVQKNSPNINVTIEVMTRNETQLVMAQRYLPEIKQGDKRILMIDGEPVPFALARIAAPGETRANLAAGGSAHGMPLSDRERWICAEIGPTLREKGLMFVGLDVIGDYITEINVTSPTCIRELDSQFSLNISALLMDKIEEKVNLKNAVNAKA